MTSRRSFFGKLAAFVAAPFVAKLAPVAVPKIGETISIRMPIRFLVSEGMTISRMDVLYGFGSIMPEFACRISADVNERLTAEQRIFNPARLPS